MKAETYLFLANAAVWLGIGAYVAFMAVRQKNLEKRLIQLEMLGDDS